jgi:hypothetical protein
METQKVFFKKFEDPVAGLGIIPSFPNDKVTGISVRMVKYFQIVVIILLSLFTGACNGPSSMKKTSVSDLPVKVNTMLISQLGPEHFGNAIFRHGLNGPRIAASGNRILEFPVQVSAPAREVVPVSTEKYTNGACTFDVNNDVIDEMIVGRAGKQEGTDLLWFEEVPDRNLWKEHLIANVRNEEGDAEKGFHDIMPFETKVSNNKIRGVVALVSRKRLYWYQIPDDVTQPWKEHKITDLSMYGADCAQSGLVLGDITGNGRPDLVCGNFWAECPNDPTTDEWQVHRYNNWDSMTTPELPGVPVWVKDVRFGGMNQLDLGDMDGDGKFDIIATDAEVPEARVGIFCRDMTNPGGLWKETIIDTATYCPHSLVVADVNKDKRPDILVGEMTAGGWWFPRNLNPHLYLYLNLGNMKFRKHILHTGWGVHMMRNARLPNNDSIFVFAADEIQSWYEDMITRVVGWTISPK